MAFDKQRLDAIFEKTDGQCHICRKKLARRNYGVLGSRGAWEVEHSKPQSKGGSNRLNNLYSACISCNRNKGTSTTRSARNKNGFKAAPLPHKKKTQNAILGGIGGIVAGRILLAPLGPLGLVVGAMVGAMAGKNYEPE